MKTLTENQLAVIEKYQRGEITMFNTPEDDMKAMGEVVEMAEALLVETDGDPVDDLIKWFYAQYKLKTD